MSLKDILGEDYREDMTDDEISSAMEKKFLATGKYENKEKVDAERRKAAASRKELEEKIKSKMSDDELKAEIENLKAERAENNKKHSKNISNANLSEVKTILELKDNDKEFDELITSISGEDSEVASKTSSYIMKLVKNAYEKGKTLATKESLGNMGKQVIGSDGKTVDPDTAFVKNLLNSAPKPIEPKNSNFN